MYIKPDDLKIETYPQNSGGFNLSIPSGIKLTHLPSGTETICNKPQSQHKNRLDALLTLQTDLRESGYSDPIGRSFDSLLEIVDIVQDPLLGDPWTIEQTSDDFLNHLVGECDEVVEAFLEGHSTEEKTGELGDLMYNIISLAIKSGIDIEDIILSVSNKLTNRHSHVFGDDPRPTNAEEARELWLKNKLKEV